IVKLTLGSIAIAIATMFLYASCGTKSEDKKEEDKPTDPGGDEAGGDDEGGDEGGEPEPVILGDANYGAQQLAEVQITEGEDSLSAEFPKIIWNGTDYSLLWVADGGRHVKFQKMGKDGKLKGTPVTVFENSGCTP